MIKEKIKEWKDHISIRFLFVTLLVIVGCVPMLLQGRVLISSFLQGQIDNRMMEVQNQCQILSNKMTRSGYMSNENTDPLLDGETRNTADLYNGRIVLIDKNFNVMKDTFDLSNGRTNISEEVIKCFLGENSSKYYRDKYFFSLTLPIYASGDEKKIDGVMLVTASTENFLALSSQIEEKSQFLQMMSIWILLLVAWGCAALLMKPFQQLQKVLNRVADGHLNENINEDTYKETKAIASALNQTLIKLKTIDQSREEFVSNVSHELKTPITSIRVLADSLMGMEEVPVELYREFMSDISEEIDRESKIIDDLLSLVRMDKATKELNVDQADINALVKSILKRLRPIAKRRNIELIYESVREVTAEVDEMKLSLALSNLVENAIKYNVVDGWVKVTLDADHKFFYVKVADSGIGIPQEYQEYIFERFYRVDKARSRENGGTGLGLAITKSVILMHHGAIKVQSQEENGTTFTVRIPLTYIV